MPIFLPRRRIDRGKLLKPPVLVVGIILLVVGGIIDAVGASEFFGFSSCITFVSNCNYDLGRATGLLALGGALFTAGIIVTIAGVVITAAPHLNGVPSQPRYPVVGQAVITKEVGLIQCPNCGSRYQQGTLKCVNC